ncbi:hypothetical protein Zm00014a_025878 [Zea mays]|uniref:Uncharacterized protein n=2 Tax=Zea mays TaxID=4577 RepID=A0A1D6NYU3_MAIZE|nr:hypothetical protein ZEAMMB73_Zm00001d045770 [Zea mays]PWZ07141.1 hypothetical protein Zm00014a_025878 [Zea mays]
MVLLCSPRHADFPSSALPSSLSCSLPGAARLLCGRSALSCFSLLWRPSSCARRPQAFVHGRQCSFLQPRRPWLSSPSSDPPRRALSLSLRVLAFARAPLFARAQRVSMAKHAMASSELAPTPSSALPPTRPAAPRLPVPLSALPARSGRAAPFVAPRLYRAPTRRSPSHARLPQAAMSSML